LNYTVFFSFIIMCEFCLTLEVLFIQKCLCVCRLLYSISLNRLVSLKNVQHTSSLSLSLFIYLFIYYIILWQMAKDVKSSPVWNLTKSDARSNFTTIKRLPRTSRSPSAVDVLRKFVTHISGWCIILLFQRANERGRWNRHCLNLHNRIHPKSTRYVWRWCI